jgi:hypothetical protein
MTSIFLNSGDKCSDDFAVTGVHNTMSKLTEALHEAAQRLL